MSWIDQKKIAQQEKKQREQEQTRRDQIERKEDVRESERVSRIARDEILAHKDKITELVKNVNKELSQVGEELIVTFSPYSIEFFRKKKPSDTVETNFLIMAVKGHPEEGVKLTYRIVFKNRDLNNRDKHWLDIININVKSLTKDNLITMMGLMTKEIEIKERIGGAWFDPKTKYHAPENRYLLYPHFPNLISSKEYRKYYWVNNSFIIFWIGCLSIIPIGIIIIAAYVVFLK